MAVSYILKSQLKLVLANGINPSTGDAVYKTKTINNVKSDATADGLYAVANSLAALQQLPLYQIERNDNSEILGS